MYQKILQSTLFEELLTTPVVKELKVGDELLTNTFFHRVDAIAVVMSR